MNLFATMGIGARGLSAAQTALDVVGQNITNADTEGYSRKRMDQVAESRPDAFFGQYGMGVDIQDITRARDDLLTAQLQELSTQQGQQKEIDLALSQVEDILAEPSDTGLNEMMGKFWNSWQDLANHPADLTARQAVLDTGDALAARFRVTGESLNNQRVTKNEQIVSTVDQVNSLLTQIAKLNDTVATSELGSERTQANDTRDRRDVLIRELSNMVDVSYSEDAQGRYLVTSSGNLLVSPDGAYPLKVERNTFQRPDGGQIAIASLSLTSTRAPFTPQAGSLKGLMEARDDILPRYQGKIDTLARNLVKAVNDIHSQGYDLRGTSGANFFDPATTGASDMRLTDVVKKGPMFVAAAAGGSSLGPGAPLGLNVPAAGTALDLPQSVNPLYRDLVDGSVAIRSVGPPSYTLKEGADQDYVVDLAQGRIHFNNYGMFPAGTALQVDFRYNSVGPNGEGSSGTALKIAQLKDVRISEPDQFGINTATVGDSYATLIGALGAERNGAKSNLDTSVQLQKTFSQKLSEVTGVSLDEEMADMVKFQHSYQASAKYLSTVNDMLQTLISL